MNTTAQIMQSHFRIRSVPFHSFSFPCRLRLLPLCLPCCLSWELFAFRSCRSQAQIKAERPHMNMQYSMRNCTCNRKFSKSVRQQLETANRNVFNMEMGSKCMFRFNFLIADISFLLLEFQRAYITNRKSSLPFRCAVHGCYCEWQSWLVELLWLWHSYVCACARQCLRVCVLISVQTALFDW